MPVAKELADHYLGFVKFAPQENFPNVDVYAEIGSGLPTIVGMELRQLVVAPLYENFVDLFWRDGDGNEEDLTNDAIRDVWTGMQCHRFEFQDNPRVDHFSLPFHPEVLQRLVSHLGQPRSGCSLR